VAARKIKKSCAAPTALFSLGVRLPRASAAGLGCFAPPELRHKIFLPRNFLLDFHSIYLHHMMYMVLYSSRQAAKKLGIDIGTLSRYISAGKVPAPSTSTAGGMSVHLWTEAEIENVRQLLPKIANGRKTRYQKLRAKQKAQAKSPVPRKPKKK
jgi:hypothetical protein